MNIEENKKKSRLSEDLTVVLIRGNGSPRSFRLSVTTLQRTLTALGFLFATSVLTAVVLLLMNLFRDERPESTPMAVLNPPAEAPLNPSPIPAAEEPTASEPRTGLWQKITGAGPSGGAPDSELQKEVEGLRGDVARLNAQIDHRKDLPAGNNMALLQFFGPRSVVVTETEARMQVKNPKVGLDEGNKQVYLDFELHNVDPSQRQVRGYIVVLAKTKDFFATYPANALSPSQNIVLDFTKGETFGVSRFRQARATFPATLLDGKRPLFQILLFANDGRILANLHVEGS